MKFRAVKVVKGTDGRDMDDKVISEMTCSHATPFYEYLRAYRIIDLLDSATLHDESDKYTIRIEIESMYEGVDRTTATGKKGESKK